MNKSMIAGILAAATVIIGTAGAAIAPAASAATPTASGVRAAIQSAEVSTSVQILTTKPNSITVIGHGGQPVTVWTKGTQPITKKPASASPVTFTGLKAGQSYAVYVGATQASVVRTLTAAGVASAVTVQAGPLESSIDVSWSIDLPASTKASSVAYLIEATSSTASPVTMKVIGTDHALITGLNPDAKYTFTVTPMVGTIKGTPASATMIVTVAEAFALAKDEAAGNADPVAKPAAPVGPVEPAAPAAPATPVAPAAPAPAAPSTKTIYVCPDGFSEAGGDLCQRTLVYTYTTSAYTYHAEPNYVTVQTGTRTETVPGSSATGCSNGGTLYGDTCYASYPVYETQQQGTKQVKDAGPAGYTDNGSAWQQRDAMPAGYSDNGSAWVQTAAKVAKVVPA
ncbi:MAG: fibronectin type III domain-containing protein [Actinobacteria bacterium]|nr:fibronectin type III domain-containing protein [Actinomycetota bacterium]